MFEISSSLDISQLILKRQLRGNNAILMLIKGINQVQEFISVLEKYSSSCLYIFNNKAIDKPTYDEVAFLNTNTHAVSLYSLTDIIKDIQIVFPNLSENNQYLLSESLNLVLSECYKNGYKGTILQNVYYRVLNTLKNHLNKCLNFDLPDNKILYIGKLDKFDVLTFTVLGLCGVDVVICDLTSTPTSDCLCDNRFTMLTGSHVEDIDLSFLEYVNKGIKNSEKNIVVPNEWVNFNEHKEIKSLLKLINWDIDKRFERDKWKVLHIAFKGIDDELSYGQSLDDFLKSVLAIKRKYVLFDGVIEKPSYEESQKYYENFKNKDIFEIFKGYPFFYDSGIVAQIDRKVRKVIEEKKFSSDEKKRAYLDILYMWIVRYLNLFFTSSVLVSIPLMIVYENAFVKEREKDIFEILSLLPIDIVVFKPEYLINDFKNLSYYEMVIGASNNNLKNYPQNKGISKISTVAYTAEKELDNILYSDTSMFKIKQFKKIRPIVLKTTYEEIYLYWKECAKFRPSFELVGDLVSTPTIFEKINGVNEKYIEDIASLIDSNVLIFDEFPIKLMNNINMVDYSQFIKQLVFKDTVDYKKFITSPYYNYSVYSEETQNLIIEKINQLIKMDWCNNGEKNLIYKILETLFLLPQNIMQIIHNYDFTADVPKVIYYNGSNVPCTLEDCIILMFLKLIGFDILVFAPTGYRVIEQYISNQWFNEVTIGSFDFNLTRFPVNVENNISNKGNVKDKIEKRGFFSWLLN